MNKIIIIFLLVYCQISFSSEPQQTNKKYSNKYNNNLNPFKPGDGLFIGTLPDTMSFFNRVISIDDMGFAEFPIIGRVEITKMSTAELTEFVKKNFQQYLRTPNVYVKPMLRASILGGVANPGLYYFDYHQSLWDVVRLAGGTTLEDGIKEMVWERDRDEVVDDLIPYFEKGISLRNMGFKSGDQLWTPTPGETFWDQFRTDVIPIITFATSMIMLYLTYQQQQAVLILSTRR